MRGSLKTHVQAKRVLWAIACNICQALQYRNLNKGKPK